MLLQVLQLLPLKAGAAFRSLTDVIEYAELETISRQKETWMREASLNFAKGKIAAELEADQSHECIQACESREAAFEWMIRDGFKEYGLNQSILMLTYLPVMCMN